MDDRPETTIARATTTYFLLHQQDEVRLEIEDGNLILIQTDAYGEEAKIYVGCAYIDHFTDILSWALKTTDPSARGAIASPRRRPRRTTSPSRRPSGPPIQPPPSAC